MTYLKFILLATLGSLAAAEMNITLNANGPGFEATETLKTMLINCHDARPGQFPWQATIFVQRVQREWNFFSGALISRNWVVTVATRLRGSRETRVILGSNRFREGQQIFSQQVVLHPRFRASNNRLFDIAVIRLNNPITLSGNIRPVSLPPRYAMRFDGEHVRISGFGSAAPTRPHSQLRWAELRVTNKHFCRELFPNSAGPLFFCAMNNRRTSARSGFGDIGAPLVWRYRNNVHIIGLTVTGTLNNANRGAVVGFLNLSRHIEWLRQFTR